MSVTFQTYDHRLKLEFYAKSNELGEALEWAHEKLKRDNPKEYEQAEGFEFFARRL